MPATESCLQNLIIIQKILHHRSPDSMDNLKLRLINKSFNSAVIHQIRTTHRSIRMEVPGALDYRLLGEAEERIEIGLIHVNKHCVKTERIFDYLGFLKEVAKVKVKHLVMINIWATVTRAEWRKDLHDKIHELLNKERLQTFIGMRDLCLRSCEDCYYMARYPSEYGPIQLGLVFKAHKQKENFHYKKLIIDDLELHKFVLNRFFDGSTERLLKTVPIYVNPFISCDQLCLKIGEFHWKSEQRLATEPLPLEIIEKMCDVWKPDSILIEYDYFPQSFIRRQEWWDEGIFTPVRFDEFRQEAAKSNVLFDVLYQGDKKKRKLSSVTIDMRNTEKIYRELIDGSIDRNDSYSNLIANVRMLFPTDKIIIIGQSNASVPSVFNQECFENILKSVWKNKGRMEVTIQHELPSILIDNNFDIPDSIDILGRRLDCTLLPERLTSRNGFIGRTYQITDRIADKTLNLELFVPKKPLNFLKNFY